MQLSHDGATKNIQLQETVRAALSVAVVRCRECWVNNAGMDAIGAAAPAAWREERGGLDADGGYAGALGARTRAWDSSGRREPASASVILWLILATVAVAAAAIVAGGSGYPIFSLGLAFGFAVGAIPYGLLVLLHASATEITQPRTVRRRRMTDEEWRRIFGPRPAGAGTTAGSQAGPGWARTDSGAGLDERAAFERLELGVGATMRDATRAYHRLAHRFHPDLTAGLPERERALAEQRMKDLNAAYALLRSRRAQEGR